jgi:fructose/tagatose bisphosphate aldolase
MGKGYTDGRLAITGAIRKYLYDNPSAFDPNKFINIINFFINSLFDKVKYYTYNYPKII